VSFIDLGCIESHLVLKLY